MRAKAPSIFDDAGGDLEERDLIDKLGNLREEDLEKVIRGEQEIDECQLDPDPVAWFSLALVLLISINNEWQYFFLAYANGFQGLGIQENNPMYEIKEAFPPLQEYYGLLSGLGYIVPFVGFGFLVGSLSDQVKSRKTFMGLAVLTWSGCVALTGFTDSFTVFVLMRVLLGVFESITNPVSYSLLRDIFPPDYRSTAN